MARLRYLTERSGEDAASLASRAMDGETRSHTRHPSRSWRSRRSGQYKFFRTTSNHTAHLEGLGFVSDRIWSVAVTDWQGYQEEVADLFRSLGLSVATNQRIEGTRTFHDVDVVVRSKQAGIEQLWLIECKKWHRPISKDKVLTLRTIVDDTGADRGFMMAESGYQSGTFEAANRTNMTLTSIADLKVTLSAELGMAKLRSIADRVDSCRERYWEISKRDRIALGLRPEVGTIGYSGVTVMAAVDFTARHALRRGFPIKYDRQLAALLANSGGGSDLEVGSDEDGAITNPTALHEVLAKEIGDLEARLDRAESVIHAREDE